MLAAGGEFFLGDRVAFLGLGDGVFFAALGNEVLVGDAVFLGESILVRTICASGRGLSSSSVFSSFPLLRELDALLAGDFFFAGDILEMGIF